MVTRTGMRALVALAVSAVAYPSGYIGGGDLTLQIFESDCSTPKSFPSGIKLPSIGTTCIEGSAPNGNALALKENTCCAMGQDLGDGPAAFSHGGDEATQYGKFVCGDDGVANIFLYADDQCTVSSAPSGLPDFERGTELNQCKPLSLYFADANDPSSPAHEMFVQHQLVCRQGFPIAAAIAIPVTFVAIALLVAIVLYVRRYKKHKKDRAEQSRLAQWRQWQKNREMWSQAARPQWMPQSWAQWRPQWQSWNPWAQPRPQIPQQPHSWHPAAQQQMQQPPAPHSYAGQAPRPVSTGPHYAVNQMPPPPPSSYGAPPAPMGPVKGKGKGKGKGMIMSGKGKGKGPATPMRGPAGMGKGKGPQGPPSLASFDSRRGSIQSQRGAPFQPMARGRSPAEPMPTPIHRPTFRPSSLPPSVADRDEVMNVPTGQPARGRLNSYAGPPASSLNAGAYA